jgi:hypothetical protein
MMRKESRMINNTRAATLNEKYMFVFNENASHTLILLSLLMHVLLSSHGEGT